MNQWRNFLSKHHSGLSTNKVVILIFPNECHGYGAKSLFLVAGTI
jgi:hypothetical protein